MCPSSRYCLSAPNATSNSICCVMRAIPSSVPPREPARREDSVGEGSGRTGQDRGRGSGVLDREGRGPWGGVHTPSGEDPAADQPGPGRPRVQSPLQGKQRPRLQTLPIYRHPRGPVTLPVTAVQLQWEQSSGFPYHTVPNRSEPQHYSSLCGTLSQPKRTFQRCLPSYVYSYHSSQFFTLSSCLPYCVLSPDLTQTLHLIMCTKFSQ